VWSFKSILTTHVAGDFCLICLYSYATTVNLAIPAVSEINIIPCCCACSNGLSKSSAVYVCELSVSIYLRSVYKRPRDCCQTLFPICLSVANAHFFFDPVDIIFPIVAQYKPVTQITILLLYHLICHLNARLVSNFSIDIVLFIAVTVIRNPYWYIASPRTFSSR